MTRLEEIRRKTANVNKSPVDYRVDELHEWSQTAGKDAAHILKLVDELAGALEKTVTEIRKYHQNFDAHLFVAAERALAKLDAPGDDRVCDCAAATEGKWADIHSPGCARRTGYDRASNGGRQAARGGGQEAEKALRTSPTLPVSEDKADD